MAEDLRLYLQTVARNQFRWSQRAWSASPGLTQEATPQPTTPRVSDADQPHMKVVPKGLRSFDEHDADFFLELCPDLGTGRVCPTTSGSGNPHRTTDPDKTFRVGLIYGPSGCGKSSLVKAGLLPRLGEARSTVYIEATPEETETRFRGRCGKLAPICQHGLGLVDSLTAVRKGRILRCGSESTAGPGPVRAVVARPPR